MKTLRSLKLGVAMSAVALAAVTCVAVAQVPGGLWRFGTSGAYAPQVNNCVEILAMNSSGQTGTDSGTPCTPVPLTTAYTNALATTYTAVIAMPQTAANTTNVGECELIWEDSSTSGTATFAAGLSAAPTDLWVLSSSKGSAYSAPTYTTITNATTTAVTSALTTGAANTAYNTHLSFVLQNTASAANTLTVYAQSNSASYTLTVEPGSYCVWLP